MKLRTKAFIYIGISSIFFLIILIYMIFIPFGLLIPKIYETDKFVRGATLFMMSICTIVSPLILLAILFRKLPLIVTWLIIQGTLWQFNIIITLVLVVSIVRASGSNKSPHDAGVFIFFVLFDVLWILCIYNIWQYWKLLNDIKHFPIFERYELEARGGKQIEPQQIDFDTVSMKDFDRLAAFGWNRG